MFKHPGTLKIIRKKFDLKRENIEKKTKKIFLDQSSLKKSEKYFMIRKAS